VAAPAEPQLDAVVDHPLAPHPLADAELGEQVDRPLLEHAGADTVLDVVARAVLEDDRLDALSVQQLSEREPRRTGAHDADLGAAHGVRCEPSAIRPLAALLVLALALAAAPRALADADPPSDVLLAADYYLPYQPRTAPAFARALRTALKRTKRAGLPLKVAIVSTPADLGAVPAYLGQPQKYADFLNKELPGVGRKPLLVVQPFGFGGDDLVGAEDALQGLQVDTGHGANGLVATAVVAVQRIAKASGHPIKPVATPKLSGGGAPRSSSGGTSALLYVIPVTLVLLALVVATLRGRRQRPTGKA
jgi:hypothetical protein